MTSGIRMDYVKDGHRYRKKVFGLLEIPYEFYEKTMRRAGYKRLELFGDKTDYILDLKYGKRFHAVYEDGEVELHLDRTFRGKHMVADWEVMIARERRRLRETYHTVDPDWKPKTSTEHRQKTEIVAPNVKELQKIATKLNAHIPRLPLWRRILIKLTI